MPKVAKVSKARKGLQVTQVLLVLPVIKGRKDKQVLKDQQVLPGHKVLLVLVLLCKALLLTQVYYRVVETL